MTNTSNITTVDNSTTFENKTIYNNKTNNLDESSGMIPEATSMTSEATPTSEPTKKPTEKRSTEIIDILIGSRRRRAGRVSQIAILEISCI